MESRSTDICIVGAGFAGLAAARAISAAGASVVVLEARDRVGGRVWNFTLGDGTVLSVGGTWLGQGQDRMFALCREVGLDVYPHHHHGDKLLHLEGRLLRYSGVAPRIGIFALLSLGLGFKRLQRLARSLPLESPWEAARASELDSTTLGDWLASSWNVPSNSARALMHTTMELLFSTDPRDVSLLGSLVLARGGNGFEYYVDSRITETHLVDGGAPELATRMAADLGDAVVLSSPVRRIVQSNGSVEVFSDQARVRCSNVIVAAPPVLASRIEFDPALPPACARLLETTVLGTMIRVLAVYPEPFWRKNGLNGESACTTSCLPVTIDQTPRSGRPGVLSAYMVRRDAASLDAAERKRRSIAALVERFGGEAASPLHYVETDWNAQPWSLGGMIGHFAPGVLTSCGPALRAPVGHVHWAGSERATEMHGLMEGAVRSGERAAAEALAAIR